MKIQLEELADELELSASAKLREIVLFDLDQTLATSKHPETDEDVLAADSHSAILQELKRHLRRPLTDVMILTARDEALRASTFEWLKRRGLKDMKLQMRPSSTPIAYSSRYKASFIAKLVKSKSYTKATLYDDNKATITVTWNTLKSQGLSFDGFHAKDGKFEMYRTTETEA